MSDSTGTGGRITALRAPGFRRYAAAQAASGMAVSSQRLAELWLVLQITGAGLSLGTAAALRTAPALVLTGLGGSLADRFHRKTLLVITQATRGVIGVVLAIITIGDPPSVQTVYLLVFALGCVGAVDQPIRRALVRDVVEPADLASAASLHTATLSLARMIGPLIAGGLMATAGVSYAYVFSVACSMAAISFVLSIRLVMPEPPSPDGEDRSAPGSEAGTQVRIWSRDLRSTYVLLGVFSVLGWNVDVTIPLIADDVLGGGEVTYSVLVACIGTGAFAGSLLTAARASRSGYTRRLTSALSFFSLMLASMALTTETALVAISTVATGIFGGVFLSLASASVQTHADRAVQGRQVALLLLHLHRRSGVRGPVHRMARRRDGCPRGGPPDRDDVSSRGTGGERGPGPAPTTVRRQLTADGCSYPVRTSSTRSVAASQS